MEPERPRDAGAARKPLCSFEERDAQVSVWAPDAAAPRTSGTRKPEPHGRAAREENGSEARDPSEHAARNAHETQETLPLVYLHVYDGDGADVVRELEKLIDAPFALAAIRPACWNDDLTPWTCPGLFADDAPFAGRARKELSLLEERIVPRVESELQAQVRSGAPGTREGGARNANATVEAANAPGRSHFSRTIAGYSLAGLFAAWAAFNSQAFSRIASASGSLWYPGFARYVAEHDFARIPECASFSLGSKESKTPSRLLRNVASGTDEVVAAFREKGVPTRFVMNPGNHFKEPAARMARAIAWAISQPAPMR